LPKFNGSFISVVRRCNVWLDIFFDIAPEFFSIFGSDLQEISIFIGRNGLAAACAEGRSFSRVQGAVSKISLKPSPPRSPRQTRQRNGATAEQGQ